LQVNFFQKLQAEINLGLPGWEIQKRMAPPGRAQSGYDPSGITKPRESAVLIWLYLREDKIFLRLIVRGEYGVHGGQVAFPGGERDAGDTGFWHTALREAYEEIGLLPDKIKQIGALTPLYIPPSNFWVHPFIGTSEKPEAATISVKEVQKYFDVDIMQLLETGTKGEKLITVRSGEKMTVPVYTLEGHIVWGATAMMLSELEELIRRTTKN
jgi:8-oxo-dGTP pyrophosphatase MutT (NUDIX family)